MKGHILLWAGKHLIAAAFDDIPELRGILKDCEGDTAKYKPFRVGMEDMGAAAVIGAMAVKMQEPTPNGDDPPECPKHGPMKKSQYGGWYCTKKEMGEYCQVKVSSDGVWDYGKKRDPRRARD